MTNQQYGDNMVIILKKYQNGNYINQKTVREEFYSALVLNKYIIKSKNLCIGTDPNDKFPDIISEDSDIGFEVTNCEEQIDYDCMDIQKLIQDNNYIYNKKIKNKINEFNKKYKNFPIKIKLNENKIESSSLLTVSNLNNYMIVSFIKAVNDKLTKLNDNHYSSCKEVSLIIINHERLNGKFLAKILQNIYYVEVKKYKFVFSKLYLISNIGLYEINKKQIKEIHIFKNEDEIFVKEINERLIQFGC